MTVDFNGWLMRLKKQNLRMDGYCNSHRLSSIFHSFDLLIEGWKKALQKVPTSFYQPIISIVIAVRNEADNIANL